LLATHHNIDSIAFPNISTGIFGYPKELAAKAAIAAVKQHQSSGRKLEEVIFCCFDEENFELYDDLL
jgi:O-acetyl-ADP-ribose deacetylase (regulator of RNase III)